MCKLLTCVTCHHLLHHHHQLHHQHQHHLSNRSLWRYFNMLVYQTMHHEEFGVELWILINIWTFLYLQQMIKSLFQWLTSNIWLRLLECVNFQMRFVICGDFHNALWYASTSLLPWCTAACCRQTSIWYQFASNEHEYDRL